MSFVFKTSSAVKQLLQNKCSFNLINGANKPSTKRLHSTNLRLHEVGVVIDIRSRGWAIMIDICHGWGQDEGGRGSQEQTVACITGIVVQGSQKINCSTGPNRQRQNSDKDQTVTDKTVMEKDKIDTKTKQIQRPNSYKDQTVTKTK